MTPPERSAERDGAIEAVVPAVPLTGWSIRTLLEQAGPDADLLFPGGPADMVEAYIDLADRRMAQAAFAEDVLSLRVSARIRRVIALRLEQARADKVAIARALGVLAMPQNALLAVRTAARTVDAIWLAAGDDTDGFARYSKRATLAPIYAATLLFWLRDDSADDVDTLAFLDRRLAAIGVIGKLRRRVGNVLQST